MSQGEAISRKDKKAQRDLERRKTGKKRKHEEIAEPEEKQESDELQKDFIALEGGTQDKSQSRKRQAQDAAADTAVSGETITTKTSTAAKRKKRRKVQTDTQAPNGEEAIGAAVSAPEKASKTRFIVFVGNLPYTTTDTSLHSHFKKLLPFTLRHRTDPKTKQSKGFAFLEFENYDRMKTCLKLYHHSMFDPTAKAEGVDGDAAAEIHPDRVAKVKAKEKRGGARRINVELTAGGGGKAEGRKEKIKAKNVRLEEQRKRRAEAEGKEKEKEKDGKTAEGKERKAKQKSEGKKDAERTEEAVDETAGMHPARLARLNI